MALVAFDPMKYLFSNTLLLLVVRQPHLLLRHLHFHLLLQLHLILLDAQVGQAFPDQVVLVFRYQVYPVALD